MLASMSGSAIADTAALATLLLPMMRRQNYPEGPSGGSHRGGRASLRWDHSAVDADGHLWRHHRHLDHQAVLGGIVPGVPMGIALIFAWRWVQRGQDLRSRRPAVERAGQGARPACGR